jgi:hypothetical protein
LFDSGRRASPEIAGVGQTRVTSPSEELERLAAQYDQVQAFVRPNSADGMQLQVDRLLVKAGPHFVAHEERMQQAQQALGWIAQLAVAPDSLYDFQRFDRSLEAPLFDPELSPHAAAALAQLGTAASQQALVNLGKLSTFPDAARQAAADGLATSIGRFGVLLPEADSEITLETPLLRPAILEHLADKHDHDSQAYLANLASDGRRALDLRQAAAAAFVKSVAAGGVLLDSGEAYRQYERYNASEKLDKETQQLLASLLDAMAAAAAKADPKQ